MSITYIAVAVLAYLGVENATEVVNAAFVVIVALMGLYGRYRAGNLTWYGTRK